MWINENSNFQPKYRIKITNIASEKKNSNLLKAYLSLSSIPRSSNKKRLIFAYEYFFVVRVTVAFSTDVYMSRKIVCGCVSHKTRCSKYSEMRRMSEEWGTLFFTEWNFEFFVAVWLSDRLWCVGFNVVFVRKPCWLHQTAQYLVKSIDSKYWNRWIWFHVGLT